VRRPASAGGAAGRPAWLTGGSPYGDGLPGVRLSLRPAPCTVSSGAAAERSAGRPVLRLRVRCGWSRSSPRPFGSRPCCWTRRASSPAPCRAPARAETSATLMLSAFLVSRPSYDPYLLVVLPLPRAGLPCAGAVARTPWFWFAPTRQVPGRMRPYWEAATRRAFKDAFTLCVLAVTVARYSAWPARGGHPVLTRPGQRRYPACSLCVLACSFSREGPLHRSTGPMTSDQHAVCVTAVRSGLS
jgi:hypothetical protein